ncbi:hypothetical protein Aperf_G00000098777 [Anoplocephala perfoliata]
MVLTGNQPHTTKSIIPSSPFGTPSKQTLLNLSHSTHKNSLEDDDAATITNGSEKPRRATERPRRLTRSNAFFGRQRRSKSTGGRDPPDSLDDSRPRMMSQEMTEMVGACMDVKTKPIPLERGRNSCWDAATEELNGDGDVFVASPLTNPEYMSPYLRPGAKIKKSGTPDRTYSSNSSSFDSRSTWRGNAPIRHRIRQAFARSTPDINTEVNQNNSLQVEKLLERLKSFENGNLPKIPPELSDAFPQDLPRHDFTVIENMWSQLTSNSNPDTDSDPTNQCRKGKDMQLSAIMELLYTEACYIKTLETIIDVHIAVYLDLTKSTTTALSYNPVFCGGSLSHLVDSMTPSELAPLGGSSNSITASSNVGGIIRRFRGRNGHDSTTNVTSPSSSLNSLSTIPPSDSLGFSAPPVEDVFGNIGAVYRANHRFWTDCFEPEIVNGETLDVKYCIRHMQKAFSKFKEYFEPYIGFLETYNILISNIRYLNENSKFFYLYHEWTKSSDALNSRESLTGLLAQPFQRLMRYGILIKRIKESTVDEYEIAALTEMIDAVDNFVKEADINQPEQEARSKLDEFIQRIHKYTFAETVRSLFGLELPAVSADIGTILRQPMRINGRSHTRKPIAEVQAKVKSLGGKVSSALCVLLSDMVLICKQSLTKKHLSIYCPPIPLAHLTIQKKKDDFGSYIGLIRNEYGLLVDCYSFSSDEKDLEEWISKVLRQKTELLIEPHPLSINRNYSTASMGQMRQHDCMISYERYGSRLGNEPAWKRSNNSSVDLSHFSPSSAAIKRPQQFKEGTTGLFSALGRREPIFPQTDICKDVLIPDNENTPVDKHRNGFLNKTPISKRTSSASDSSDSSNSTTSSANILTTTSGDSFRGSAISASFNAIAAGIPPKSVRHSLGREAIRPSEVLKTDSVAKRQTS